MAELEALFGKEIASIVAELTDDKSLPKAERKKQQILNASKKSNEASLVKLADTTSNIGAIANSPPDGWSLERRLEYIGWANTVVGHLPLLPKEGLAEFLSRCDQARSVRLRMLLLEHPDTSIFSIGSGAVRRMRTRIGFLAQPEFMHSRIEATQRKNFAVQLGIGLRIEVAFPRLHS